MTSIQLDLPPAPMAGAKIERVLGSCDTEAQTGFAKKWAERVIALYREQKKPDIEAPIVAWIFFDATMRILFYAWERGIEKMSKRQEAHRVGLGRVLVGGLLSPRKIAGERFLGAGNRWTLGG